MKTFKSILAFVLFATLVSACGPGAVILHFSNPYTPLPEDSNLMTGEIKIDSSSVFLTKDQPPQVMVNFAYFPPTPCYKLRVEIGGTGEQHQISLKAYAVAPKDKPCTLMALSTPQQASLNLGSVPKGHYTVLLNGEQIGEFDA